MKTKVIHQNYRHDITVKLTPKLLVSIIIRDLGELCTATHTGDANTLATARLAASESTLLPSLARRSEHSAIRKTAMMVLV